MSEKEGEVKRKKRKMVDVVHQATIRIIITGVCIIYTRQWDEDGSKGCEGYKKKKKNIFVRKKSVHEIKSLWEPLDRLYFSVVCRIKEGSGVRRPERKGTDGTVKYAVANERKTQDLFDTWWITGRENRRIFSLLSFLFRFASPRERKWTRANGVCRSKLLCAKIELYSAPFPLLAVRHWPVPSTTSHPSAGSF